MCKLYLQWSKFLCNFTAWGCIETTLNQNNQFPLLNSVTFCNGLQGDHNVECVDKSLKVTLQVTIRNSNF